MAMLVSVGSYEEGSRTHTLKQLKQEACPYLWPWNSRGCVDKTFTSDPQAPAAASNQFLKPSLLLLPCLFEDKRSPAQHWGSP